MKTGINPRRTYWNENERNKHNGSSNKCRCGGHSFSDSKMKDASVKLILHSNDCIAGDKAMRSINRKSKIDKKIKIRKAQRLKYEK